MAPGSRLRLAVPDLRRRRRATSGSAAPRWRPASSPARSRDIDPGAPRLDARTRSRARSSSARARQGDRRRDGARHLVAADGDGCPLGTTVETTIRHGEIALDKAIAPTRPDTGQRRPDPNDLIDPGHRRRSTSPARAGAARAGARRSTRCARAGPGELVAGQAGAARAGRRRRAACADFERASWSRASWSAADIASAQDACTQMDPTRASWSRASWSRASWSTSFTK